MKSGNLKNNGSKIHNNTAEQTRRSMSFPIRAEASHSRNSQSYFEKTISDFRKRISTLNISTDEYQSTRKDMARCIKEFLKNCTEQDKHEITRKLFTEPSLIATAVEQYYIKATEGKTASDSNLLRIVASVPGSGKSHFIKSLEEKDSNIVVLDLDEATKMHPEFDIIHDAFGDEWPYMMWSVRRAVTEPIVEKMCHNKFHIVAEAGASFANYAHLAEKNNYD